MPISKRDRVIHTSKVKKHDKGEKNEQIESIRSSIEEMRYAYVLSVSNERNNILKKVRDELKPGKMFYSKNKLVQVALGFTAESECADGIHALTPLITGHVALITSNLGPADLATLVSAHEETEFARAGAIATHTIALEAGFEALAAFPFSMETQLRKLGLPTMLHDGKIKLLANHTVCTEGEPLTANQAQVVKRMGIQMAKFSIAMQAVYDKESSQVTMM